MFRIKICGLTNPSDALFAAEAGADAIGLNFFKKSTRFVELDAARKIAAAVPAGVMRIGVFVNHSAGEITQTIEAVGLDGVQLHGDEPAALFAELPEAVTIVRAFRCAREGLAPAVKYLDEVCEAAHAPHAYLVDSDAGAEYGGTGRLADWKMIASERGLLRGIPLILAGGLNAENVASALATVRPDGVDVASGVERQPGVKDPELVKRFVAAARAAFERI